MIEKSRHPVSSALFGVAAIQAVIGFLGWSIYGDRLAPLDWVITFSFALFAGLAILARWARISAAVIAALLYGAFLILQASISMRLLMTGLMFKVPNVILLATALIFAFKPKEQAEQREEGLRESDPKTTAGSTSSEEVETHHT